MGEGVRGQAPEVGDLVPDAVADAFDDDLELVLDLCDQAADDAGGGHPATLPAHEGDAVVHHEVPAVVRAVRASTRVNSAGSVRDRWAVRR